MPVCGEDTRLKALSVLLQHPALAADQQNVCRLLQVCKSWRSAVQQSSACITNVCLKQVLDSAVAEVITHAAADVARFAHWVSEYAGGIRSIKLECEFSSSESSTVQSNYKALAQHVLALCLRSAAAMHSTPAAVGASNNMLGSSTAVAAPLQPLRLQRFTCGKELASPLVLSALPPATLTHLDIAVPSTVQLHEQLCRFSNLRSLQLTSIGGALSSSYASAISKLCSLTSLHLEPLVGTDVLPMLPGQLKQLDLSIRSVTSQSVDVSQLHQLQHLCLDLDFPVLGLVLPQQLQSIGIDAEGDSVSAFLLSSTSLQHVTIGNSDDKPQELLLLKQLPKLKTLDLCYNGVTHALDAATVWSQLEQLAALRLNACAGEVDTAAVVRAVKTLGNIQTLHLEFYRGSFDEAPDAMDEMGRVCETMGELTQLQELHLILDQGFPPKADDLLHLSRLTALTSLDLDLYGNINHINLSAVLLQLTKLRSLALWQLGELYTVPVIGRLLALTELKLFGLSTEQQGSGLKYLTGMRNLRQLGGFDGCSKDLMREFWQKVHA